MTVTCDSVTRTCGTGAWTGPKPGDPDNNSALSAVPAFGGIDISWTYPSTNPHAVAHVLLYRSIQDQFEGSLQIAVVSGNSYRDTIEVPRTYYYWIQIVSVNGTVAEPVGPASAIPRPLIEQIIPALTGQIDSGLLAQNLRNEVNKIPETAEAVRQEILDRIKGNAVLEKALADMQAGVTEAMAFISQEIDVRTDGQNALASQIDTLGVLTDEASAAIKSEQEARIAADGVLAAKVDSAQVSFEDQLAAAEVRLQTSVETVNGVVQEIGALYTAKLSVNGLVGGFGVHNDGTTVEAGFDVDRFWVGRTGTDKCKPFIIENGEVFINQAVINKLTFNKLVDQTGAFVVENGKLKAECIAADTLSALSANIGLLRTATTGARMELESNQLRVYDENNRLRVRMGIW